MKRLDLFNLKHAIFTDYVKPRLDSASHQRLHALRNSDHTLIKAYDHNISAINDEWKKIGWYFVYLTRNAECVEQILGALPTFTHKYIPDANEADDIEYNLRLDKYYDLVASLELQKFMET